MANTIYASFNDASLAEKAAGALLDHGVRAEDISVVRSHDGRGTDVNNPGLSTTGHGLDATDNLNADARRVDPDADANAAYANWNEPTERTTGYTGTDIFNPGGASGGAAMNDISEMQTWQTTPTNMQGAVPAGTAYGAVDSGSTYDREVRANDPDDQAYVDRDDSNDDIEGSAKHGISTTTAKDAGAGAIKGGAIGLGVGALAALASVIVPGFGLVLGGGALAAALGGVAGATGAGAAAGAVTGYLKDQGVDDKVAADYDHAIANGGALVAVQVPSGDVTEVEAREVLSKYGAGNVNAYAAKGYMA